MYCTSSKIHLIVATAEAEVFYAEELESAHPHTHTPNTHLCAHERAQNRRVLEMATSLYDRDRNPRESAAFFQGVSDDMPVTYNTLHKSGVSGRLDSYFNFFFQFLFDLFIFLSLFYKYVFFHIEGDGFAYTAAQDKNWTSLYFTFIKN